MLPPPGAPPIDELRGRYHAVVDPDAGAANQTARQAWIPLVIVIEGISDACLSVSVIRPMTIGNSIRPDHISSDEDAPP